MHGAAIQFLIYGILFSAATFAFQRAFRSAQQKKYGNVALWVLVLIGLAATSAIVAFINAPIVTLGEEAWYRKSPMSEGLLYSTMLLGMAASYLTKQIEQRRARIEEKRKITDNSPTPLDFDLWEFTYPMLVSVITFGAVLQSIGERALDLSSMILSFQTGFFWQTVLARSIPKAELSADSTK